MLAAHRLLLKSCKPSNALLVTSSRLFSQYKTEADIPRRTNIQFFAENRIPVDTIGTLKLPQIPTRSLVQEYWLHRGINDELLKQHFFGLISKMFTGIAN